MAVPEGVTPLYNQVLISVFNTDVQPAIFGISGTGTSNAVGTVYKIGTNVYRLSVGQKVGFKTEAFFTTDSGEAFATADQNDVYITYTSAP